MAANPNEREFLNLVAERFRALGDPTRLGLMMTLKKRGELSVGELVDSSHLSQPAISKHLSTLRAAGLVSTRREGTTIYYKLRSHEIASLCDSMCNTLKQDHERLGAALDAVNPPAPAPRTRTTD